MSEKPHPLDPLTRSEISLSSKLILSHHSNSKGWIFNSITLLEPLKAELAPLLLENNASALHQLPRRSFVLLIERGSGRVFKAAVNLTSGDVERWEEAGPGLQPTLTPEDCIESERIVRESQEVKERCEKLGIVNMELVTADPW
jgi:primary-amine oxidase